MTKLGKPLPVKVKNIRRTLTSYLKEKKIYVVDAEHEVTGRGFLLKIWENIASVSLSTAIITEELE